MPKRGIETIEFKPKTHCTHMNPTKENEVTQLDELLPNISRSLPNWNASKQAPGKLRLKRAFSFKSIEQSKKFTANLKKYTKTLSIYILVHPSVEKPLSYALIRTNYNVVEGALAAELADKIDQYHRETVRNEDACKVEMSQMLRTNHVA